MSVHNGTRRNAQPRAHQAHAQQYKPTYVSVFELTKYKRNTGHNRSGVLGELIQCGPRTVLFCSVRPAEIGKHSHSASKRFEKSASKSQSTLMKCAAEMSTHKVANNVNARAHSSRSCMQSCILYRIPPLPVHHVLSPDLAPRKTF